MRKDLMKEKLKGIMKLMEEGIALVRIMMDMRPNRRT